MIAGVIQYRGRPRALCERLLVVALRFVALSLGIKPARTPQEVLLRKPQAGQRQINRCKSGVSPAFYQNSTLNPSWVRRP